VKEGAQGRQPHRLVVLEHGVKPEYNKGRVSESFCDTHGLRQSVGHASRTKHLERVNEHDLASQIREANCLLGVEPGGRFEFKGSRVAFGGAFRRSVIVGV
jgi:hypothetical protein